MLSLKKIFTVSVVSLSISLLASQAVYAQRAGGDDEEAAANAPTIDQQTGAVLSAAIELLNNDQTAEARAELGKLNLERLSPYERSRVEQILANLDYGDENFDGARGHMQAAIDSGGLNEQEVSQARYQIAQMWMSEENWDEGAKAMEAWIAAEPMPNSGAFYLLAVAYYQQDKFDEALPNARRAVDMTDMPQEPWLQLLQALLLQKEMYQEAVVVLKQIINLFPEKKVYWMQLSSVYATLEDFANSLVILELANHHGMVTEDAEIRRLTDMLMLQNLPYRAATIMSDAIENEKVEGDLKAYESLANSWVAAREFERSIPVLERAAELSDNGNNYVRLGEVNMQIEQWDAAATAFQEALDKGGVRDQGQVQLLIGISLYNEGKYDEARTALQRAANNQNQRQTANGFLQLIESKQN